MRLAAVLLLAVGLAGCSGVPTNSVSIDGKAVIRDAYDGRLDRDWSCGSLRAAVSRLPTSPPTYSTIPLMIDRAAGRACDAALAGLRRGVSQEHVRALLGRPDSGAGCRVYGWPPSPDSSVDGVRLCFTGNRLETVTTAVHG